MKEADALWLSMLLNDREALEEFERTGNAIMKGLCSTKVSPRKKHQPTDEISATDFLLQLEAETAERQQRLSEHSYIANTASDADTDEVVCAMASLRDSCSSFALTAWPQIEPWLGVPFLVEENTIGSLIVSSISVVDHLLLKMSNIKRDRQLYDDCISNSPSNFVDVETLSMLQRDRESLTVLLGDSD